MTKGSAFRPPGSGLQFLAPLAPIPPLAYRCGLRSGNHSFQGS